MIEIIVYGEPAPQGSKRHVGHGILVESSKKVKPWREAVVWSAREAKDRCGSICGPVIVEITFTLRKPKTAPKLRRTFPDRRPDLDKLCRSTLDGLVTSGVIEDDARVVLLVARKVFPLQGKDALDVPGAVIRCRPMEES